MSSLVLAARVTYPWGWLRFLFQTKVALCFLAFAAAVAAPDGERQLSQKLGQISEKAGDTLKQDFYLNLRNVNLDFFHFCQSPTRMYF